MGQYPFYPFSAPTRNRFEISRGATESPSTCPMRFLITGTDTSGTVALRRDTAAGALKKLSSCRKMAAGIGNYVAGGCRSSISSQRMAGLLN
jgi:hypothetical protein